MCNPYTVDVDVDVDFAQNSSANTSRMLKNFEWMGGQVVLVPMLAGGQWSEMGRTPPAVFNPGKGKGQLLLLAVQAGISLVTELGSVQGSLDR